MSIEHEEPWELSPEQTAELQARLAAADRGELVDGELVLERLRVGL